MMALLIYLLATVLLFSLPEVELREESRSVSNSRSTSDGSAVTEDLLFVTTTTELPVSPTTTEIDPGSFCSMVFDNIGPFCQSVIQEDGTCLSEFSDTTCDSCANIINSCGTTNSSICTSTLVASCPQNEVFLMEFCSVVARTCIGVEIINNHAGQLASGDTPSGSGSGSASPTAIGEGKSRSGSSSTSVDVTTESRSVTDAAGTTTDGVTIGAGITDGVTVGAGTTDGDGPSPTTSVLVPLVLERSLTQQQRENIVPVGFRGINEERFLQIDVFAVFRDEVATIANMDFSSDSLSKRQAQFSRHNVFVIKSPNVTDGVLIVRIVVGGQGSQSSPISRNDLAMLLQMYGERLAAALSSATGLNVEFVNILGLMSPTTTEPSNRASVPSDNLLQASSNTIIGIIVGVTVAIVVVISLVSVIAIISFVKSSRKKKTQENAPTSTNRVEIGVEDDGSFSTSWQPMKVNANGDYVAVPSTFIIEETQDGNNTAL